MKVASKILAIGLAVLWGTAGAEAADQTVSASAQASEWGPIDLKSQVVAPGTKAKFTFM